MGATDTVWIDHVAIDRITGFAAEHKLFNAEALASPRFRAPLLVQWHPDDPATMAAVALLLFALRDAEQGLVWVGSRTTRGYGHLDSLRVVRGTLSRVENGRRLPVEPISAGTPIARLPYAEELVRAWNLWRREVGKESAA